MPIKDEKRVARTDLAQALKTVGKEMQDFDGSLIDIIRVNRRLNEAQKASDNLKRVQKTVKTTTRIG